MKLQTKIISIVILVSMSANMVFLYNFISNKRKEALQELNQKIENTSELLNNVNARTLYDYDKNQIEINLQTFFKDPEIKSISLTEKYTGLDLFYDKPEISELNTIEKITTIFYFEEEIGEVTTVYTTDIINKEISEYINQLIIAFIFVTLIISLSLFLLLGRIIKPISTLTGLSSEIANGNLEIDIKIESKDEIGTLAQSFIKMRDSIKQKIESIEIANEIKEQMNLRINKQQEAIIKINSKEHYEKEWIDIVKYITKNELEIINLDRIGIWLFNEENSILECHDLYSKSDQSHKSGIKLNEPAFPIYFSIIERETVIAVDDAANDKRLSELNNGYIKPNGICSKLDAPIRIKGKVVGIVSFEQINDKRIWKRDESTFIVRIAEQVASFLIEKERRLMVKDLQESEERSRTLVENAPDAIAVIDIDTAKFVTVNENAVSLFGIGKEELLKLGPVKVSPSFQSNGASSETILIFINKAFNEGSQYFEWMFHNLETEQETLCEVRIVRLPSSKRKLIRASILDISERKKQEIELQKLRNYLTSIIDSMPSVLVGVDSGCRVTLWNKKAEEATGISAENANNKLLSGVFPEITEDLKYINESIQTGEIIGEKKRSRQSEIGSHFEDVTVYPLITNDMEGAVIRIDDVTDIVRMEEMMIQSEKMLSVGGLAAGMAHEINNPLAGMMQTANVMARRLGQKQIIPANEKAAEQAGTNMDAINKFMKARDIPRMLGTIKESGKRVAEIVDNMLSFSRKSEGEFSTNKLDELLDKSVELASTDYDLKKEYDFKQIEIIREYEEDLLPVPCEGAKIQQVLLNLLRNGAQAMDEVKIEYPHFILRTFHDRKLNMICMEVEDNGPGMDEAVRKRIFEPFFTTKPVGIGTGLGLSVSYFIITENHNGTMVVDSQPGCGTKFTISLPLFRREVNET